MKIFYVAVLLFFNNWVSGQQYTVISPDEKIQAIIQGGQVRLRPILMTTATTVLGLLPMALGLGDGAEIRTPMAITVIIGLITSTILTLVVIPTVYALVDRKE